MNNPYYEAIIAAKNLVFDEIQYVQDALDNANGNADSANEMLNRMVEHLRFEKAVDKVALVTVLLTGRFYSEFNGWVFYMPATRECLENYKNTRRLLKRGYKLHFDCID